MGLGTSSTAEVSGSILGFGDDYESYADMVLQMGIDGSFLDNTKSGDEMENILNENIAITVHKIKLRTEWHERHKAAELSNRQELIDAKWLQGSVLMDELQYDEALQLYEECLLSYLELHNGESPAVASTYHCVGVVYDKKKIYNKALENYQHCVRITLEKVSERIRL